MTAPVASGWSELAGWGFHPLESAAFARRTSGADVPVFERSHVRHGGFQILKRLFSEKANTIQQLNQTGCRGDQGHRGAPLARCRGCGHKMVR